MRTYNTLNGKKKGLYYCKDRVVKVRTEDPVEERTYIEDVQITGCGFVTLTCGPLKDCPRCHSPEIPKIEDVGEKHDLLSKHFVGAREI
jgi:hypothetical protein